MTAYNGFFNPLNMVLLFVCSKEARREKMIREEMKMQLHDKDSQLTKLMTTQREVNRLILFAT